MGRSIGLAPWRLCLIYLLFVAWIAQVDSAKILAKNDTSSLLPRRASSNSNGKREEQHDQPKDQQREQHKSSLGVAEVVGRSGNIIKILHRPADKPDPAKQPSILDLEQMKSRRVKTLKVCMEGHILVSAWVPIMGTEIKVDFVPDTETIWNEDTVHIIQGVNNNTLHVAPSYSKNCHFKSNTMSTMAKVSTCDGNLTGSVLVKNEICVIDPDTTETIINVCHRSVESFDVVIDTVSSDKPRTRPMPPGTHILNTVNRKDEPNEVNSTIGSPILSKELNNLPLKMIFLETEVEPEELAWINIDAPIIRRGRSVPKEPPAPLDGKDKKFCGMSPLETVPIDPYESEQGAAVLANFYSIDYSQWKHELVIELAVFADAELWARSVRKYGSDASRQLQDFITSILNNAQLMYQHDSMNPKPKFSVVRYEVFTAQPYDLYAHGGDAMAYLKTFCNYQHRVRSREFNWDHSILFTGYDLIRGGYDRSISGIARIDGVCSPLNSCLLAEAIDFNAAFIVAHEMGHSLGMLHDEPYCRSSFIMSESLGAGKVVWSECSISAYQKYLNRLDKENRNCMTSFSKYDEPKFQLGTSTLPGQKYNADQQCELMYGPGYYHEHTTHTHRDICYVIWCRKASGLKFVTSHPALEGTPCDHNKHCISGQCVPVTQTYRPFSSPQIYGGWSLWSSPQCSYCQCPSIVNGLGVVPSRRSCTPGRQCHGGDVRGVVCSRSCTASGYSKQTVEAYVNAVCTAKKARPEFSYLLGTGSQMTYYAERACHVFCDAKSSDGSITRKSWSDFLPDGSPCGNGKYCLEGKCLILGCDSTALVSSNAECSNDLEKCLPPLSEVKVTWTGWSAWSSCSATCGYGLKSRARSCVTVATSFAASAVASGCEGHDAEKSSCNQAKCEHYKPHVKHTNHRWSPYDTYYTEYDQWSAWATCSTTCGEGVQWRSRNCPSGARCWGISQQERPCFIEACTQWGGWGYWSTCNGVTSQRRRIRKCYGRETCPGNDLDVENC